MWTRRAHAPLPIVPLRQRQPVRPGPLEARVAAPGMAHPSAHRSSRTGPVRADRYQSTEGPQCPRLLADSSPAPRSFLYSAPALPGDPNAPAARWAAWSRVSPSPRLGRYGPDARERSPTRPAAHPHSNDRPALRAAKHWVRAIGSRLPGADRRMLRRRAGSRRPRREEKQPRARRRFRHCRRTLRARVLITPRWHQPPHPCTPSERSPCRCSAANRREAPWRLAGHPAGYAASQYPSGRALRRLAFDDGRSLTGPSGYPQVPLSNPPDTHPGPRASIGRRRVR